MLSLPLWPGYVKFDALSVEVATYTEARLLVELPPAPVPSPAALNVVGAYDP